MIKAYKNCVEPTMEEVMENMTGGQDVQIIRKETGDGEVRVEKRIVVVRDEEWPNWTATERIPMRAFLTLALAIVAMMCLLESCGESTGEATSAAPAVPTLEQAIAERGEPCECVVENLEAMSGLLESLKSTEKISAQEINIQKIAFLKIN